MNASAARTGFLTSEFALTVVGVLALLVLVLHGDIEGDWAAGAIAFACFGYSASRAFVKKAAVDGQNEVANYKADLALVAAAAPPAPTAVTTDL